MATLNIDPPKQFNFNNLDDWPRRKKRFEHFWDTPGLSATAKDKYIPVLFRRRRL